MKFITITTEETMRATFPGADLFPCVDCAKVICMTEDRIDTGDDGAFYACPACIEIEKADRAAQRAHFGQYLAGKGLRPQADALSAEDAKRHAACDAFFAAMAAMEAPSLPLVTAAWAERLPRDLYALQLAGDALAPTFKNGQQLVIDPTERHVLPGEAVIATVTLPGRSDPHVGIYFVNADGDLTDNRGGFHEAGTFTVGGVVTGI